MDTLTQTVYPSSLTPPPSWNQIGDWRKFEIRQQQAIFSVCRALARRNATVDLVGREQRLLGRAKIVGFIDRQHRILLDLAGELPPRVLAKARWACVDDQGIHIAIPLTDLQPVAKPMSWQRVRDWVMGEEEEELPPIHFWSPAPPRLWRLQRRQTYRLSLSTAILQAELTVATPGWPSRLPVSDISVGGLALEFPGYPPESLDITLPKVLIELPNLGSIMVDLYPKHIKLLRGGHATTWSIGCSFDPLPEPVERRLQAWLLQEQRNRSRYGRG